MLELNTTEHTYSSHTISNNQAVFKVNGTRTSIFKSAVFAYSSYSRTFRHKVTVSVEKGNIAFSFSSKNL